MLIAPDSRPLISVIIPARNEEENIYRSIHSVMNQEHEHYEVIVVDDQSKDSTAQVVEDIEKGFRRIRLIRNTSLKLGWTGKRITLFTSTLCLTVLLLHSKWSKFKTLNYTQQAVFLYPLGVLFPYFCCFSLPIEPAGVRSSGREGSIECCLMKALMLPRRLIELYPGNLGIKI